MHRPSIYFSEYLMERDCVLHQLLWKQRGAYDLKHSPNRLICGIWLSVLYRPCYRQLLIHILFLPALSCFIATPIRMECFAPQRPLCQIDNYCTQLYMYTHYNPIIISKMYLVPAYTQTGPARHYKIRMKKIYMQGLWVKMSLGCYYLLKTLVLHHVAS